MGIKDSAIYKDIIKPLKIKLIREPYNKYIKQPYRKYKEKSMDDESYFMQRHKDLFGYKPDFKNPQTFNEKIIHRMLYDRKPIYTALADKLKARIYIATMLYPIYANKIANVINTNTMDSTNTTESTYKINTTNPINNNGGGGGQYSPIDLLLSYKDNILHESSPLFLPIDSIHDILFATNYCVFLPKLYGIYNDVASIDFNALPESFVLKTNHNCGGVVIVENKHDFLQNTTEFDKAMQKLTWHLHTNYYDLSREYHYKDIEPRIFAEELLGAKDTDTSTIKLSDTYKFHIFSNDDTNNFIQVTTDRFTDYQRVIMDHTWNKAPFGFIYDNSKITKIPQKPKDLDLMFHISHLLADPFDYVRVDLYDVDSTIYVGELTFTHAGGTEHTNPREWDAKLGTLWIIDKKDNQKDMGGVR